jgi:hypothetical protein
MLMVDEFGDTSHLGILGKVIDSIFIESSVRKLLIQRSHVSTNIAESSADRGTTVI